jgi:hypothetical protein
MTYSVNAGIQVSLDQSTWYSLTDHNRQPIKVTFDVIEKTNRMADGTLRRFVVARKHKITSSWQLVPSSTSHVVNGQTITDTVDGNKGGSWMKSFYEANVFTPVYVKLIIAGGYNGTHDPNSPSYDEANYFSAKASASNTANPIYMTYITNFDYEVNKRNKDFDLVNINIEFTEV